MYTPFEILQLKEKHRKFKLTNNQSKQQKSLCIKFDRQGQQINENTLNQSLTKSNKLFNQQNQQKTYLNSRANTKNSQRIYKSQEVKYKDKKYQVICRESIRKVNTYRTKVYHTHRAFKDQTFMLKLDSLKQRNQRNLQEKSKLEPNYNQIKPNTAKQRSLKSRVYYSGSDSVSNSQLYKSKNTKQSQIIKFKIFLNNTINTDSEQIGLDIPQFLVQKCKIFQTDQRQKQKIQRAIQKLYSKNIAFNQLTVDSGKNQNLNQLNPQKGKTQEVTRNQRFNNQFFQQGQRQKQLKNRNIPRKTSLNHQTQSLMESYQKNMSLYQTSNSMNQCQNQYHIQNSHNVNNKQIPTMMKEPDLMNFIRKSKKKRLPVSRNISRIKKNYIQQQQKDSYMQFRRTITEDCKKRQNQKKQIQIGTYRKNSISPTKIKFNTIDQNISGWDIDNLQIYDQNVTNPSGRYSKN